MQLTMQRSLSLRPVSYLALIALLVLALAAAALFVGSQRRLPPPFGVARNGAIVFDSSGDLLIADDLRSATRMLVSGPEADTAPRFSNQGDHVAFLRGSGNQTRLMAVRPDGSELVSLGTFPGFDGFRWSPDGRALLVTYTETDVTGFQLAVVEADGSGSRTLDVGRAADWASWRPDGRHIAFRGQVGPDRSAVFVAEADGTDARQLPIESTSLVDFEGLAWSPDGTRLSFMADGALWGADGWRIGVADIDAEGGLTTLRRMKFAGYSGEEMLPSWSPDSTWLAFIHQRDEVYQIAIGLADGTAYRLVGPETADRNGLGYAWSPDGRTLLISSRRDDVSLWSVDVASGAATPVDGPADRIPAWQRLAP
jgi:Tol biopolymer transport system component